MMHDPFGEGLCVLVDPSPASPDAVLYQSWPLPEGGVRLEYLSDGAEQLLELTADELARRISTSSLPLFGVNETDFYEVAAESLTHHNPWRAEFGYIGPRTGRRRWLRGADFPHRTPDGVPYFVGIITDLTAAKQAEEETGRAYRQLASHLDNVPLAVVEWDEDFRVKRWSPQAEALFGWAADEMIGRHPDEVRWVHPADQGRVERVISSMLSGVERKTHSINRNLTKAGRELVMEWHTSTLLDPGGRVVSFVSFARDLTSQFATELELTLSEERLRTALRASRLLAWDLDRQTGQTYYSDHCGEFHGVEGVGASPSQEDAPRVIHPDDLERVQREIAASVSSDATYSIEYRGAAPGEDGLPRWFVSTGRPVLDPNGQWVRRLGVVAEVTARKREEAEREELDRQLNEARRYESLGVLAGGIAHDFNNLLTVILGNAAVVRSGVGNSSTLDAHLGEIETACKRAAHLCSQMTAYAGVGRMAVGSVDAATLLRQLEPTLRADAGAARLTLSVAPDLPPLHGEPFQVRQAVRNVVTNAGEATPPGGWVKVEVERRAVREGESGAYVLPPPPGEYLVVRVSDSGSGMSADVKAKAFDPFFSTKFAGRGLGLAAVLGIVRGHRGGVRLATALNRGTLIELFFPLTAAPADQRMIPPLSGAFTSPTRPRTPTVPPVRPAPAPPPVPTTLPADRGTVLVCDDELNIRELIASVMEADGFKVVRARDGSAGVTAFQSEPGAFVLAVVDLLMPGLGGHDVIRQLRKTRPGLPAVVVTGFADREVPADVRTTGPTTLLPKPFRLEQLSAVVEGLLTGSA